MLGFSSVASRRNCCTARCCSIWYLLFIATLSFFLAEKSTVGLLWAASLRVATFYELPGKVVHDSQEVVHPRVYDQQNPPYSNRRSHGRRGAGNQGSKASRTNRVRAAHF